MFRVNHEPATTMLAMFVLSGLACGAQGTAKRYPLTSSVVAAAFQHAGFPVDASRIELPATLSTSVETPALGIISAELLPDGRLRVRLSCAHAGDCPAFFASVHPTTSGEALSEVASLNSSLRATLPMKQAQGPALKAGGHTMLLMEDRQMRIALPVISIDSGAIGSEVRVSSLDHKAMYRGVVMDDQTVRGTLP